MGCITDSTYYKSTAGGAKNKTRHKAQQDGIDVITNGKAHPSLVVKWTVEEKKLPDSKRETVAIVEHKKLAKMRKKLNPLPEEEK